MNQVSMSNPEAHALKSASERIEIQAGSFRFTARLEAALAPRTCEYFKSLLPISGPVLHCRWSGESLWAPFTPHGFPLEFENANSFPHPGQILIYAQTISEPEILIPYGACAFNSKVGRLAGNHFLTIDNGANTLNELGHDVLWKGCHTISFRLIEGG